MQTPAPQSNSYESLEQFYREAYAPAIQEARPVSRLGASMIRAVQGAGDWSDAATPDLVIGAPTTLLAPATLDMGGGRFTMCDAIPNAFVMAPPGFANTAIVDGPHAIQFLALPYSRLLAFAGDDSGLPPDGDFGLLHRGYHIRPDARRLLARLWDGTRNGSPGGSLWADGMLLQLAGLLLHLRDGYQKGFRGGLAAWQVRRAFEMMSERLAEDVGLDELAKAVDLSASHFSRSFKVSVGMAPYRWLAERRIEQAKLLLADNNLGLTEIAQSVGFGGQSAFGAAFKRITGLTPSEYRRLL